MLPPNPLFAMGQVATAQNSTRFCGKIESDSPLLRRFNSPFCATGCAGCASSMLRSKILVSTAKLTTEHLLSRDKCSRGLSLDLTAAGVQVARYVPIQGMPFPTLPE